MEAATGDGFTRVLALDAGPALIGGVAGSGRTELLARKAAALCASGTAPDRLLLLTRAAANRAHLRERVAALLDGSSEDAAIETWTGIGERLLREHALEAGIDPFFEVAGPADRLALLLDRLDELPLRRHEIRGNPAGLLAGLLERIDALKRAGIGPADLRDRARAAERGAAGSSDRDAALRELEFSELFDRHDAIMLELGMLDEGELVLELGRLLSRHPELSAALGARYEWLLVDELEDAGAPQVACLPLLAPHGNVIAACDPDQGLGAERGYGEAAALAFRERFPAAELIGLGPSRRSGGAAARALATAAAQVPGSYRRSLPAAVPAAADTAAADVAVRFWRCANERAEAQAVAREIEHALASGASRPEDICVLTATGGGESRLVAAALEERNVPFRSSGSAALFGRPEIRDAIAWMRALADPNDSAAVVRALTRPPTELRSVDLARCTTIARRRKLDMISAVEAALDSPQLPPPSRDRLRAFLKLYRAAAGAFDSLRADVFVRRLIERVGFRRHALFAASPETAERLVNLSRLAELAAAWTRRRPDGSTRDFVRYLAAVAEAGQRFGPAAEPPPSGAVMLAEPEQVKGMDFDRVYMLGLGRGALRRGAERAAWVPDELPAGDRPPAGDVADGLQARRAYVGLSRARGSVVLSRAEQVRGAAVAPSPLYEAIRAELDGREERHEEELFGPAEGLHATYRMLRDEVLEASWRAGAALSEMRLDTAEDVNRAVARYFELLKLAALIQRPGDEPERDAIAALNELIGRIATPEQLAELSRSALDEYVLDEDRDRTRRSEELASRAEPGLEAFLPQRGGGLALSASDVDLYRTCPLKYKFARVFAIPQEPTINQRFGILIHNVLERYHAEELRDAGGESGGLSRLLDLFEAGWRRTGFGFSDDELQYRDRAVAALARYHERHTAGAARPVWLERRFSFRIGETTIGGRVDRVDRHPDGSYELIDYKTGPAKSAAALADDLQIALYRVAAREAWDIEAADGAYWYVLDDEKVPAGGEPDAIERVGRTVAEVAAGITGQDFEPRPSFEVCSWCDYRLICPASEA
ncbi:MAG TPA: ATP-dependent DNA helicase [Solirubrobacterales bacterium]|nr:ATP-dependent DNA helicase [Solirubrobacterales bacterium]